MLDSYSTRGEGPVDPRAGIFDLRPAGPVPARAKPSKCQRCGLAPISIPSVLILLAFVK
jgi:hypothetical protein